MSARMWQYTAVDFHSAPSFPHGPKAFADFLNGMDISGWEFVAAVNDKLVFRRRYPAPTPDGEQRATSS